MKTRDIFPTDSDLSLYLEQGAPESFRYVSVDDLKLALKHFINPIIAELTQKNNSEDHY